jgi:hypothetical protein
MKPIQEQTTPLLTGDVLFQQRIDKCMQTFTWALGENNINGLVGMYSSVNGLYIDVSHYLEEDKDKEVSDKLDNISERLSRAIVDEHQKSITQVLNMSRACMKILINKCHEKGFIVRKISERRDR